MRIAFWFKDNGRWLVAVPTDFEIPDDRIIKVWTKGKGLTKVRLATEPSKTTVDRDGHTINLWGQTEIKQQIRSRRVYATR